MFRTNGRKQTKNRTLTLAQVGELPLDFLFDCFRSIRMSQRDRFHRLCGSAESVSTHVRDR